MASTHVARGHPGQSVFGARDHVHPSDTTYTLGNAANPNTGYPMAYEGPSNTAYARQLDAHAWQVIPNAGFRGHQLPTVPYFPQNPQGLYFPFNACLMSAGPSGVQYQAPLLTQLPGHESVASRSTDSHAGDSQCTASTEDLVSPYLTQREE